jgi:lysophospholipase L1-like esterase
MTMICVAFAGMLSAAEGEPELAGTMPVRVIDAWTIAVGPGEVELPKGTLTLSQQVLLDVAHPELVQVRDEEYRKVAVFNPDGPAWRKGVTLRGLAAQECSATGLLVPESVRVKPAAGAAQALVEGTDYVLEAFWANFGRKEGGAITADQPLFLDYDYSPCRLDSVVVDTDGNVKLLKGEPAVAIALPPETTEDEVSLANVWVPGRTTKLTEENLYPIQFKAAEGPAREKSIAEDLLPKTLAKLREGKPVTIVAWGDSVTNGGGVGARKEHWYQHQFLTMLKERFPRADITLKTAAWGGSSSARYMAQPRGSQHDFVRDVLEPNPDMVTIEFVNDAYLSGEKFLEHYGRIMEHMNSVDTEVVLITPHYVRPDWMGVDTLKVSDDPRPYVRDLRAFAEATGIALADASKSWGELWLQGIPYTTLLANAINHPDARGHAIFAETLIGLFPSQ